VVEFAMVVPFVLVIILFALDLGRLFYSYISLHDAARTAANYAGSHPFAKFDDGSEYAQRVEDAGLGSLAGFCSVDTGSIPAPTFTDSGIDSNVTKTDLGDNVTVTLTCQFGLVTPVVSSVLGENIDLEATAVFPIRQGTLTP
jgi:Flp pilus assembly protein TadG